ncbi:Sir2 family histone deacetylase Hst4 [Schizosaccharomyces japonicus yFS275]|uniref:Sir2 family histone deacetylase Hst4 n=1 Tax=Schizosaccharomyces japonicus (strain yFS275 / FY16936) TaxID=402676 RepID=B6K5R3_SCHJY|nr:Sir2 family histone deacetylase Hst4 [Schizosaccharomyces japonicus yFS275]EEB08867.2 Sir2 family histone deacetylase Hst4 [Schizosaccharomyces japonicus yFS275]
MSNPTISSLLNPVKGGPKATVSRKRKAVGNAKQSTKNVPKQTRFLIDLGLPGYDIQPLASVLQKSKRIVVITGAGISCQAGIPDFRSSTGLFKTLRSEYGISFSGKEMFDNSVYRNIETVNIFHEMIKQLYELSKNANPTDFHYFLAKLAKESRLLRLYTQNIDYLETRLEGLETSIPLPSSPPWPLTIALHGTLEMVSCTKCGYIQKFDPSFFGKDGLTACPECRIGNEVRRIAGKRSTAEGCLRPRIVLYNESHPDSEAIGSVCTQDLKSKPDCLIIAGTSCKIPGVKRIIKQMSMSVRRQKGSVVWMNHDPPNKEFDHLCDVIVTGDCQTAVKEATAYVGPTALNIKLKTHGAKKPENQRPRVYKKRAKVEGDIMLKEVFRSSKASSVPPRPKVKLEEV